MPSARMRLQRGEHPRLDSDRRRALTRLGPRRQGAFPPRREGRRFRQALARPRWRSRRGRGVRGTKTQPRVDPGRYEVECLGRHDRAGRDDDPAIARTPSLIPGAGDSRASRVARSDRGGPVCGMPRRGRRSPAWNCPTPGWSATATSLAFSPDGQRVAASIVFRNPNGARQCVSVRPRGLGRCLRQAPATGPGPSRHRRVQPRRVPDRRRVSARVASMRPRSGCGMPRQGGRCSPSRGTASTRLHRRTGSPSLRMGTRSSRRSDGVGSPTVASMTGGDQALGRYPVEGDPLTGVDGDTASQRSTVASAQCSSPGENIARRSQARA